MVYCFKSLSISSAYSAESSKTVPRDFNLVVVPVSSSWEEGLGLDLENYRDLTNDATGSNWINSTGDVQRIVEGVITVLPEATR